MGNNDYVYILVWKNRDGKFNLTRSFENKNLLEYFCGDNEIKFSWDIELVTEGYYAYEVVKD